MEECATNCEFPSRLALLFDYFLSFFLTICYKYTKYVGVPRGHTEGIFHGYSLEVEYKIHHVGVKGTMASLISHWL